MVDKHKKPMSPASAARLLKQHNKWRRWDGIGAGPKAISPEQLGKAIDAAVRALAHHQKAMNLASQKRRLSLEDLADCGLLSEINGD